MSGRAFVLGDKIDTDVLAPGALMKLQPEALAQHCLEAIAPDFAKTLRPGDVVVAGASFGIGSSREQAAVSLKILGVKAVLAKSFARIFYRNAFNLGLPALMFPQADEISDGDQIDLDLAAGRVVNLSSGKDYAIAPIPAHLRAIVEAGGIVGYLRARQAGQGAGDLANGELAKGERE
jgi:3-isopropylmalate/(R)-2-methylmalate dehydratase small subunit